MDRLRRGIIVVLLVLAPHLALAGPAEEASAVLDHWTIAFDANDPAALTQLYAPDATLLGMSSPLLAEGMAAIQKYFSRLPGSGDTVAIGEHRMVALSDTIVVATGFYDFTLVQNGEPVPMPARFTMVIAKRGDAWLIVHHHSSQRPKPAS
jgi:uncharacterized protein (TIGR02246 family)